MAFKHIHRTLLLHQGQAINENKVDLTSHRDWGSMMSSPLLKTMWNSPRNPVGALVTEESRKVLWEAMHAEGEGVDLGNHLVYPVTNTKESRWVMMMWNGEVKRFEQGMRLECPQWEENLPQEESKDHANPNSQGTSSGYAEETVAGLSRRHKDSPQ